MTENTFAKITVILKLEINYSAAAVVIIEE